MGLFSKSQPKPGEVGGMSATEMLRQDHQKVKGIFDEFESTEDGGAKRKLVETCLIELTIHAKLEEEIFYPACRKQLDDEDIMDEATEEHHVAKLLIAELADMKTSDDRYDAKFMVLAESVRHHIEEEEGEILPKIEKSGFDLESLGQQMAERKLILQEEVSLESIVSEMSGEHEVSGRSRSRSSSRSSRSGGTRSRRSSRGSKSRRVARGRSRQKV